MRDDKCTSGSMDNTVRHWDHRSGRSLQVMATGDIVYNVVGIGTSKCVSSGSATKLFDLNTGKTIKEMAKSDDVATIGQAHHYSM